MIIRPDVRACSAVAVENAGTVQADFYIAEARQEWDDPMRRRGVAADAPRQVAVQECEESRKAKFTTNYGAPEFQPPPSFSGRSAVSRAAAQHAARKLLHT